MAWNRGRPETAAVVCPHCGCVINESHKTEMVSAGRWNAQRPDIKAHAGFRLNTLVSLLANARWAKLVAEYERARRSGPAEMQVFVNTVLGQTWKTSLDEIDEFKLREQVEDFGLVSAPDGTNRFPRDVFLVLAGVDTQDDRFEVAFWGFNETEAFFLSHDVVWGDPADSVTQAELDALLKTTWLHPNGWQIGIEGTAIDSAGHKTQAVYDFCGPRLSKKIFPIVSKAGPRKIWTPSKSKPNDVRPFIVGHDEAKTIMLQRLVIPPVDPSGVPSPGRIRYSSDLPEESFEQLTAEKRVVRYVRNQAVVEFMLKRPGLRNEALDMACYVMALRHSMRVNFAERRARRGGETRQRKAIGHLLAH
jgi:phage terminase large subunit GpA-like protein